MVVFLKCFYYNSELIPLVRLQHSTSSSTAFPFFWQWIFSIVFFITTVNANVQNSHDVIEGIVGEATKLRCKATKYLENHSPVLVLWYKDGARLPFFTLDLREGGPEEFFDDSMRSRVNSDVMGKFLTLRSLIASDTAHYICKVDYDNSPSLEAKIHLIVYEPPNQILIQDELNQVYSGPILGPINQGSKLTLFCIAIGGKPTSKISWLLGSTLVTDRSLTESKSLISSRSISGTGFGSDHINIHAPKVVSEFNILSIERKHAGANITCQANNNNFSKPLFKSLTLSVNLRPELVKIILPNEPLEENIPTRLKCETFGSYPPAKVTWEIMKNDESQVLESKSNFKDGKTISWLQLIPTAEDHGTILTCRANNPSLKEKGSHNSTVLEVYFAPRVNLQLGKNLFSQSIKEGEDVYFECEISCNPRQTLISWHKDKKPVEQNLKAGILLSVENLVLQRINRSYAGNYTCSVVNDLGNTTSNVVELLVMYLPVCSTNPLTVAVAEKEEVKLECRVKSRPSNNLKFIWLFNNTLDTVEVGTNRIKVKGPLSYIDYTPLSPRDYGTLLCWATNEVGMQAEPCKFSVIETGPPERVKNCVLVNLTVGNLDVRCSPGSNSGSSQRFIAKVYAASTHKLLEEVKRKVPRFHVTGLTPGQDYLVTVTAVNDKGHSEPEEIDAFRLKVAEKRMGDVISPPVSPLVGVFLGLVGGFLLLLLVGLLLSRARSNRRSGCWSHKRETESKLSQKYSEAYKDKTNLSSHQRIFVPFSPISRKAMHEEDEDSPDLVKSSNETSQLINSRKCNDMITRRHTYVHSPDNLPNTINGTSCNGSSENQESYLGSQSPIHLPSDESFV